MSQSTEQALNSNPAAVDPLVSRPLFESLQDSNNIDYKPTHDAIGTIGTPIAKTSSSSNTIDLVASATPTTNQSNIISYTPHKSNQAQIQTPARGNPLTPPTSDEKPHIHLPAFELNSPANAVTTNSGKLERVDSMAERIAAQSARYSHSIQRSNLGSATDAGAPEGHNTNQLSPSSDGGKNTIQFPSSPSTELHSSSGPGGRPQFMGTFASPAGRHPLSVPHLTYHQLQQQQQQQHRLQHPQVSPSKSLPSFPPTTYTPVELPIGTDVGSPLNKTQDLHRSRGSSDGSRRIPSITKADPLDNPCNTANVYINGLPLRFTDDELYRLTRGFGAVKSVKMFTRHLEDKPSAYGFVLFNRVEDAERFIITLRQHTPFHPSFAKTNKVPSTANAKDAMKDPIIPLPTNGDYADISITGLPLNLDMQTLRALLAPQAIKQSRFFHTTGFPRRLVGFIRMESKQAAEDVIERLHDSNVLGWTEKLSVTMINHGSNRHDSFNHNPMSINQQAGSLGSPFLRQEQQYENNMQGHRRFSSMGNFQPMHQSNGSEQDLAHLVGGMNLDKRGRAPSLGMAGRLSNQSNPYESRDMYNPRLIQQLAELQILRMQQQPGQGSFSSKIPTGLDFGRPRSGSGGSMLGSGRQFQGGNLPPSATSGVTRNGGVPFSLPGLSPSQPDSPEGSMSSEPSPTTPVFQMHRALRTSMNSIGEH